MGLGQKIAHKGAEEREIEGKKVKKRRAIAAVYIYQYHGGLNLDTYPISGAKLMNKFQNVKLAPSHPPGINQFIQLAQRVSITYLQKTVFPNPGAKKRHGILSFFQNLSPLAENPLSPINHRKPASRSSPPSPGGQIIVRGLTLHHHQAPASFRALRKRRLGAAHRR